MLIRNHEKFKNYCAFFIFFETFKKFKKIVKLEIIFNKSVKNSGESVENRTILFSTICNRTIPGIVLSEFVLSGDPLYLVCILFECKISLGVKVELV